MKKYTGYLIDLDGTMYRGKEKIPAAKTFIERLQAKHIDFLFVTNNTTKFPEDVVKNLGENFDIHVQPDNVYTAGLATVDYVRKDNQGKKVYIIGEPGLIDLFLAAGFELTDDEPDYVVVGLDRKLTYDKLKKATLAIHKGAIFIGTNKDTNLPTEEGLVPGGGSIISAIETATHQKAIYIGKPEAVIMEGALAQIGLMKEEVVMVGDNYETDILAGIQNDIDSLLVLSGFTQLADLKKVDRQPTHVIESLDQWEV